MNSTNTSINGGGSQTERPSTATYLPPELIIPEEKGTDLEASEKKMLRKQRHGMRGARRKTFMDVQDATFMLKMNGVNIPEDVDEEDF